MDVLHITNGQRLYLGRVALRDEFEAIPEADDFVALIDAFYGGGSDNAVQPGSRATAN